MHWTTEKPTKPGFYFYKARNGYVSVLTITESDLIDGTVEGFPGMWGSASLVEPISEPIAEQKEQP